MSTTGVAPTITSVNHATFTKGTAGTFTVTATGSPAPTFTETGTLPTGVLFASTGLLSGTPTASGSFPITITAANGITPNATQGFTLTVDAAPAITSAATATFTKGTAGTFTVTATGLPAPSFTETGTLPTGVTLSTGGRALRHGDHKRRLPDHHHRVQRDRPQRHPVLHSRCRRAAGDHLSGCYHLHRRHRR